MCPLTPAARRRRPVLRCPVPQPTSPPRVVRVVARGAREAAVDHDTDQERSHTQALATQFCTALAAVELNDE